MLNVCSYAGGVLGSSASRWNGSKMTEPLQPDDPVALGRYRLVARLGRGGMGTVFLGQDERGTQVAVKVINAELAGDPKFHDRFRREADAARRVRRFCTAPVLDASLDGQPMYVVTEYIDGGAGGGLGWPVAGL